MAGSFQLCVNISVLIFPSETLFYSSATRVHGSLSLIKPPLIFPLKGL